MRPLRHPILFVAVDLLFILCCLNMRDSASGWLLWASFFLPPILACCLIMKFWWPAPKLLLGTWLILCSTFLTVTCAEWGLTITERLHPEKTLTMPPEWKHSSAPQPNAPDSFMWHGELHLKDEHGMRRSNIAWPEKQRLRVLVVGDSLTYGLGVNENDTYPAQLQRLVPRLEILNLGIVGLNSTQILNIMKEYIPKLKPDLIIYGVCLNDFLPQTKAQEHGDDSFSPPIPYWIRDPLITRTRLGAAMNTGYGKLLMTLGLRQTFIDDIFEHTEYRIRFQKDVAAMQQLVKSYGLSPVVALVLDQYPQIGSKSEQLARLAEQMMLNVDMTVIPTTSYYQKYNGQSLAVSPWEGHPNKVAYGIFAKMLAAHIKG